MMNPKLNISNLVLRLLPWHKRTPVRVAFLRALAAPLGWLFGLFDAWRDDTRMIVNVTSQVAVLEGYLRKKYGQPIAIKVLTFSDGALNIGLEEEGDTQGVWIPLPEDELPGENVPLAGEMREHFGDADFIVYVPQGIDLDLLRADIERFKQALIEYKIIQN